MNISISLTPELLDMVEAKVQSGRYTSTSEVVRVALRLLDQIEQRKADRIEELRQAWQARVASGNAAPLDLADIHETARLEPVANRNG